MPTFVGKYCVFSASGISGTSGIVTQDKIYVLEANLEINRPSQELRGQNGAVTGIAFADGEVKTLRLRCVPYDATSQSGAAANWVVPEIGTKCTIAADTSIEPNGTNEFAGTNWILTGATKRLINDNIAEFELSFVAHAAIT